MKKKPTFSIIIPAYNEEENIGPTIREISQAMYAEKIPFELVIVNDNSKDKTPQVVEGLKKEIPEIKMITRTPPGGFGRAIRTGLDNYSGEFVTVVMADLSDDPKDIVRYYYELLGGADCVFGSRFMKGSQVVEYPLVKLYVNRIVNKMLQILFVSKCNDLTNAFKAYRSHVIESIKPLKASHFNITIEMSLSAWIRRYKIVIVPINWYGRKWGQSNLRLRAMGRRYLATLIKLWFERLLILDDLMAEKSEVKAEDEE